MPRSFRVAAGCGMIAALLTALPVAAQALFPLPTEIQVPEQARHRRKLLHQRILCVLAIARGRRETIDRRLCCPHQISYDID